MTGFKFIGGCLTGFKFIGGSIGAEGDTENCLTEQVQKWLNCTYGMAAVAVDYPHSAHTV